MIITNIDLLKTPLDSNYSNVFDGFQDNIEIVAFLQDHYEHKSINLYDIKKSINLNKKIMLQLQLNQEQLSGINEYNYCIIENNNNEFFFYFIDSYDIKFTNYQTNISEVNFNLIWDAWTNNYTKIFNTSDVEYIESRHINEYERVNISNNTANYKTINYVTDEEEVPTINDIDQNLIDATEILYARIFCRSEAYLFTLSCTYDSNASLFTFYKHQVAGAMHSASPLKVIYVPLCVIDKNTRKINYDYTKYRVWFEADNSAGSYTYREIEFPLTKYGWFTLSQGNDVVYADLTFNTSYIHHVTITTENEKWIEYGIYGSQGMSSFFGGYGGDETSSTIPYSWGFTNDTTNIGTTRDFNIRVNRTLSLTKGEYENILTYNTENYRYAYEPHMFVYPYYYRSIVFGNNKIPCIGEKGTEFVNCKLDYANTTSPKLWFKNDNNTSYRLNPIYAKSLGQIIVQTNSLTEYMQSNANSVASQYTNNNINFGVNLLSSAVNQNPLSAISAGKSFISNRISINAKLADIDNKRDSITIPSSYALDDVYFQDSVIILLNEIEDEKDKSKILSKFVLYGVNFENYGNIFENSRYNFDFVKTKNCELKSLKISSYDKNIIKSIFNNGVRKWHIYGYETAVQNFDTSYVNLQKILTEY